MTSTVTSDFRHEFEQVHADWLRKRFRWYCAVIGGINLVVFLVGVARAAGDFTPAPDPAALAVNAARVAIFFAPLAWLRGMHRIPERSEVIRIVFWMILLNGLVQLVPAALAFTGAIEPRGDALGRNAATGPGVDWMFGVFISHLAASLFIPWTAKEAVRPLIPLLVVFAIGAVIGVLFGDDTWLSALVAIALSPLVGVPGVLISAWRHGRFREKFHLRALRGRYTEMKRELVDARRIHEALFPNPVRSGNVRMEYRYEPMRQIGGDFLFARRAGDDGDPDAPLSVVLIDVTGHGIPAALTVNRLQGELERLFGESPEIGPGEVLAAINSYVHYTLANHSVYATAFCLRVDPVGNRLAYASGGHPPAFLRGVDGRMERLDSTAFVLGACAASHFDPEEKTIEFAPGDALITYTDGATEARDSDGHMLTIDGFQVLIASLEPRAVAEGGWAGAVLAAVDRFRDGAPDDDTLIVEVFRPISARAGLR